jgi:hypothetical protein
VVLLTEQHPQYGNVIELDHGQGVVTRYAHNSKLFAKTGDIVKRTQKIAEVGNSGRSTGPHLHFEVRLGGVPQNPAKFLASRGTMPLTVAILAAPSKPAAVVGVRKEVRDSSVPPTSRARTPVTAKLESVRSGAEQGAAPAVAPRAAAAGETESGP